jgi:hypothetical protein
VEVGGGVTIVFNVSTSALTIWALVVAGASVLLLVAVDHRKPARRRAVAQRGVPIWRAPTVQVVEQHAVRRYRPPRWWQRIGALLGAGFVGVILGAVVAVSLAGVIVGLFLVLDNIVK